MSYYGFAPYVSVGAKKAKTEKHIQKMAKQGTVLSPVRIEGRKIATTFWGKAWCSNLEAYSDYSNRLPRGRSYVSNGFVADLQISQGRVEAIVMGSSPYKIQVDIQPLPKQAWEAIKKECAGQIGSVIELLQGKLSDAVMKIITRPGEGLFPKPSEIKKDCSCPDWADLCKHIAATLYGVGARLDQKPELLFLLRGVDPAELASHAAEAALAGRESTGTLDADLGEVFGIEIAAANQDPQPAPAAKPQVSKKKSGPFKPAKPLKKTARKIVKKASKKPVAAPAKKALALKPTKKLAAASRKKIGSAKAAPAKAAKKKTVAKARGGKSLF